MITLTDEQILSIKKDLEAFSSECSAEWFNIDRKVAVKEVDPDLVRYQQSCLLHSKRASHVSCLVLTALLHATSSEDFRERLMRLMSEVKNAWNGASSAVPYMKTQKPAELAS